MMKNKDHDHEHSQEEKDKCLDELFNAIDVDDNGNIDYIEFLQATVNH